MDRSGRYAARYIAKNVVAAGLADRCEIQIAYVIGIADPMPLLVDAHGTGREHPDFTWERTDRAALLRKAAGLAKNARALERNAA